MTSTLVVGGGVFMATYVAIKLERRLGLNRTVAVLVGAILLLFTMLRRLGGPASGGVFSESVDFDVVFLIGGMMVIVNVLKDTGFYEYIAIVCAKLGRGQPLAVLSLVMISTAVTSAFLDNVTTVLLMAPVVLVVAAELQVDPVSFLIPTIIASNIGGAATLIGDPPNILVGSYTGLDFLSFIRVLSPLIVVLLVSFIAVVVIVLRNSLQVEDARRLRVMAMDERGALKDPLLLRRALVVTLLTLGGFFLHGPLRIEPGLVAMTGAGLMLAVTGVNVERSLARVEWTTLAFFLGLFIVVHGAVEAGLMHYVAVAMETLVAASQRPRLVAPVAVLWISGIASALMNNVSYTAAALPVLSELAHSLHLVGSQAEPLWWALALGACLGGIMTPVGSAANLVVMSIAARQGREIGVQRYLKWGIPSAVVTLLAASVYLVLLVG